MHKLFVPPLLAATALFSSLSAQAQVVLTASTWVPPTHLLSRAQAEWCDDVGMYLSAFFTSHSRT